MEEQNLSLSEKTERTNKVLLIACITSLIAVAATSFFDLCLMMMNSVPDDVLKQAMEESRQMMESTGLGDPNEVGMSMMYSMIENAHFHLLFNIIESIGVIMLLVKRPIGIHFYIGSQIGFAYLAFATAGQGGLSQAMFCFLWSYLYWHITHIKSE